ncbi:SCAN domain-containing protein 3, partial [Trichinella britovi]
LLKIFLTFGAPSILQSDNGQEFSCVIIAELKTCWPELKLVTGRPRHPQSQGAVERLNGVVQDKLAIWMTKSIQGDIWRGATNWTGVVRPAKITS